METKEELVAVPPATEADVAKHHHASMMDHSDYTTNEDSIAAHRSLHRFMVTLLHDAAVTSLTAILIQDNASILCKTASRSARAAHQRLALGGRDHMIITKEISRWESYPFEVNTPIAVNHHHPVKQKRGGKNKNGSAVPQRRAKRRSGLESAGEIKADILKKAESLPRRPRRRSSVVTDDAKKNTMQHELLSLFLCDDDTTDESESNSNSTVASDLHNKKTDKSASRPKREVSPLRRIMMPKKPIRRLSELPDNNNDNSLNSSQHSTASTETTLSEIGSSRQSDLSSICEQTTNFLSALEENRLLECSAIILEEDEDPQLLFLNPQPSNGNATTKKNIQSPQKPIRRVSEALPQGEILEPVAEATKNNAVAANEEEELPGLSLIESASSIDPDGRLLEGDGMDDTDTADNNPGTATSADALPKSDNPTPTRRGIVDERIVKRSESMPKKPTRRGSEVPDDLISGAVTSNGHYSHHVEAPTKPDERESDCRQTEAQHSYSTESTASETTSDGSMTAADETTTGGGGFLPQQQQPIIQTTETKQPLDCAVIPEEDDDDDDAGIREIQECHNMNE